MSTLRAWFYLLSRLAVGSLLVGFLVTVVPIIGIGLLIVLGGATVEIAMKAGLIRRWQDVLVLALAGGFLFLVVLLTVTGGCSVGHALLPTCAQANTSRSMAIMFAMLTGGMLVMFLANMVIRKR
jgi:hypothetical protein